MEQEKKPDQEKQTFTIREARKRMEALGFKRSLSWWRTIVNKKKVESTLVKIDGKDVRIISASELFRVAHEKVRLKVKVE